MASLHGRTVFHGVLNGNVIAGVRQRRVIFAFWMTALLCVGLSQFEVGATIGAISSDEFDSESNTFDTIVAPLLFEKCLGCHGGATIEGGYSVADTNQLFRPGDSGAMPVLPSQLEASELLVRVTAHDPTIRMPLNGEPLTDLEIAGVRKWIASGATLSGPEEMTSLAEIYGRAKSSARAPLHYVKPLPISSLLLSPDSQQLLVGGYSEILVWNIATQSLDSRIPVRGRMVSDVDWAPGGLLVVASGAPGKFGVLEVFDFKSREQIASFGFSRDLCTCIAPSPYRNEIAAGFADGSIALYSLDNFKVRTESIPHAAAITSLFWSSKGDRILTASIDRSAKSFDSKDMQLLFAYAENERTVSGVVDSPYGAITIDETGVVRVWAEGEEARSMAKRDGLPQKVQPIASINGIVFVPDNDRIRRLFILQDEVVDDKDTKKDTADESKPKMKTRTRWKEHDSLQALSNRSILSLSANRKGTVAAGLDNGEVVIWLTENTPSPSHTWFALP
jgi:Planctomycete cytochrome C